MTRDLQRHAAHREKRCTAPTLHTSDDKVEASLGGERWHDLRGRAAAEHVSSP